MHTDILNTLRLIRSEGVGPTTFERLVKRFGTASGALKAMPSMPKPIKPADLDMAEKEYRRLIKSGGTWLAKESDAYPALLKNIDDAPPLLTALGDVSLLQKPMLAVVGARNASTNGRRLAAQIARDLGAAGYIIVSGLARGIDTAAHEAAIETGTVAVMANGVDIVYPPENQALYDKMRHTGVILSENALGAQPTSSSFPRRNRIISGLCQAVIVIEAAAKSGSLITTTYALDQGRDVFAVPGSPLDPRASGPNQLIKTGQAHLIESAQDVLDVLNGLRSLDKTSQHINFALNEVEAYDEHLPQVEVAPIEAHAKVMAFISPTPCDIDQLTHTSNLPASQVLAILMEMELMGQVQRLPGNMVARL